MIKNVKLAELNTIILLYNKNCQRKFDKKLKERFFNIYKFSNRNSKNFILLLRRSVYLEEYMGDQKKFNERQLPENNDFYSSLNMEDTADAGYVQAKKSL